MNLWRYYEVIDNIAYIYDQPYTSNALTYIDLNPEPVEREPGPLAILAGAAFGLFTLWIVTVFLFSM